MPTSTRCGGGKVGITDFGLFGGIGWWFAPKFSCCLITNFVQRVDISSLHKVVRVKGQGLRLLA